MELGGEELVVLEFALEDGGEGRGDIGRREERALDDGEGVVGGVRATAVTVLVEEVNDWYDGQLV